MSASRNPPVAYILAGPNGAGKTTFALEFLPEFAGCREFLNADLIAAGLSPFAPETQEIRAGRLLLGRMNELAEARESFGFETTLAGVGYVRTIGRLRRSGYRVVLFFLWLPDAEMAAARVAARVRQGGHDIPEATIRRRYESGLRNFFSRYSSIVDEWRLYDASHLPPALIAGRTGGTVDVDHPERFTMIKLQWEG